VLHVGAWHAPFGITIVADLLSAIMLTVTGILTLAVSIFVLGLPDERREAFGHHPLFHFLLVGVSGAFLAGDIFNLYVWFEVMLMSSFVLLALGSERSQLKGGIKYVTINLLASALFLAAAGTTYGLVGTLNMADLALRLKEYPNQGLVSLLSMLFLVCFGIKAALFPLFFWLPDSYHTPPSPVSAIFAGLLTKVGLYAIIRVFTLIFQEQSGPARTLLIWMAIFTMLTGVLGAAAQLEFRRTLSFHIISQVGYMLLGAALCTPLALTAAIFYIVHHMLVKTNLFLVSGAVHKLQHSYKFKNLGGVYEHYPVLACLFLVSALSLAGVPPLSGFWGKLMIIKAGLAVNAYTVVGVALVVSLLTLYSMSKIWGQVFWEERHEHNDYLPKQNEWLLLLAPQAFLAGCTLIISLAPQPLFALSERAAYQLLEPQGYILAVLGSLG